MTIEWISDPMDIVPEMKQMVTDEVERTILQVFEGVVQRTPVYSGSLRASWRIVAGTDTDFSSYVEGGSPSAPLPAPSIPTSIPGLKDFPIAYVVNCAPYADLVEDGGPKNSPHNMLAVTLLTLKD